jgi:hypothetical protein
MSVSELSNERHDYFKAKTRTLNTNILSNFIRFFPDDRISKQLVTKYCEQNDPFVTSRDNIRFFMRRK